MISGWLISPGDHRDGSRAGVAATRDHAARSPLQRPWAQPRMRLNHTGGGVGATSSKSIHHGVVDDPRADRNGHLGRRGVAACSAMLRRSTRPSTNDVRFPQGDDPRTDRHRPGGVHAAQLEPRRRTCASAAAGWPMAPSPAHRNIVGLDGVRRTGDRAGFDDLLKLAQHAQLDPLRRPATRSRPIDIHASVRHIHAAFDVLDADRQAHSTATASAGQKNRDCIEMVRIARGVDDATLDREPSIFTVINSNSPLASRHADAARHHRDGVAQPARRDDPVHPRRCDGAGHVGRRTGASRTPKRLAGIALSQIVRPGAPGRLRRASRRTSTCSPVLRRSARRVRQRTAMVGGSTGPPLQPALSQQQRVRRQRSRCRSAAYESVFALWGLCDGRRQHDDARRRVDGGWACTPAWPRWCSTPTCCTWSRR